MQLIEFKEALDDTEQTVLVQNHKLKMLNGAVNGEVLKVEAELPKMVIKQ